VTECFSPQSPDPNRRPRTNRVSPAIQFGTVHLISKLPPSPLSHKALHAHCATPFRQRHNQPTPRPTILPIPSGSRSARCLHRYAPSFPTALPQPATLFITSSPRQPPASSLSLLYTHTRPHPTTLHYPPPALLRHTRLRPLQQPNTPARLQSLLRTEPSCIALHRTRVTASALASSYSRPAFTRRPHRSFFD
jgi:hypothetical protein